MPLKGHISAVPKLAIRVVQFAPINAKHLAEVERLRIEFCRLELACAKRRAFSIWLLMG